ncbi:unnamed protein product [Allacma fusca]|uniref:Uncharacterized protein n=1 Tax=Allacma fusca TaxID=39272 RepID=A0A8J2KEL4_9HEXA|nr:unnamed protein product [Allacma fusca]
MGKACPCVSKRKGAFLAGIFNAILGLSVVTTIILLFCVNNPEELWRNSEEELQRRQSLGRILMFYIPPGVGSLSLGVLLSLATHHNDRLLSDASFMISTMSACGSGIEVVCMRIYGAQWIMTVPLIGIFFIQVYIFLVTADFRDHLLNHGRLVKSNTDRRKLQEDPITNEDSELSQINPPNTQDSPCDFHI